MKGWGANLGKHEKVIKQNLITQIQDLDNPADRGGLDEDGWALRYFLEEKMIQILASEEEYWRQRGRQNWILQGDANTAYFHAYANGRKCKCAISSLKVDHSLITAPDLIQQHVYEFYIALMGTEEPKILSLVAQPW